MEEEAGEGLPQRLPIAVEEGGIGGVGGEVCIELRRVMEIIGGEDLWDGNGDGKVRIECTIVPRYGYMTSRRRAVAYEYYRTYLVRPRFGWLCRGSTRGMEILCRL